MSLGELVQAAVGPSVGTVVKGSGAPFEAVYRVQTCDLDELNHANNVSYVRWLEWITRQHNAAFGLSNDYLKATGVVFVVVTYELQYLRGCALGEEVAIATWITGYGHYSHDRAYRMTALKDGGLLFEGTGRWVAMNLGAGKLTRMPPEHQRRMAEMAG